jgi:hypothetical protein
MQNYSPFFGGADKDVSYTVNGIKPKTTNTTFYKSDELYATEELANTRAYNIGCSGSRAILANANGTYKFGPCSNASDYKRIMKEMQKENIDRRYYDFDPNQNIYDIRDTQNDDLYEGFNYRFSLLRKSLSNVIYRDPIKEAILGYYERVVYGLVESTKNIKNYFNYTVKKNNRRVF